MAAPFPIQRLEFFTNCYGRYGVAAAIAHAPTVGATALEVALKPTAARRQFPNRSSPARR